jgi:hypothetical protein
MKVAIRFLIPGYVTAEVPDNFKDLTPAEQIRLADDEINKKKPLELLVSMRNIINDKLPIQEQIFDTPPLVAAVEEPDGTMLAETDEWVEWKDGRKIEGKVIE